MNDRKDDILEKTRVEVDVKTDEPPMYKVVLHNDDYTPKEFVVELLVHLFHKSSAELAFAGSKFVNRLIPLLALGFRRVAIVVVLLQILALFGHVDDPWWWLYLQ